MDDMRKSARIWQRALVQLCFHHMSSLPGSKRTAENRAEVISAQKHAPGGETLSLTRVHTGLEHCKPSILNWLEHACLH